LTSIDWNSFRTWLNSHLASNYSYKILRCCLKYSDILLNNEPSKILTLSKDKQRMIMASLSNLAKFLRIYQQWKESLKNSGLKWSKNNSFDSFMRIFNNNHTDLIDWYRRATNILNDNEKLYLKFMLLSGLRKNEGIESFNLIINLYSQNKLNEYYNEDISILEHFKFKQFLRNSKNTYITVVPKELVYEIATSKPVSYYAIRKRLERNNLKVRIKELRSYWASKMSKNRILISEEVDLCQGRIPKSVFARHYLKENLKELSNRVLEGLRALESN
jgi:intergrase/recombinase